MESPNKPYDYKKSAERIQSILKASETSFEELDHIPDRDELTYSNGCYVNCSAVFFDIVDSSKLPEKYKRPKLAKIYRAFISESVSVFNGNDRCREVNIAGDCVWGVFDTPKKVQIDNVFSTVARLNSLRKMLNCLFSDYNIDPIKAGIGVSWGRALMIQAGAYGSGVNDIVWMGNVVNEASNLCALGSQTPWAKPIMVSKVFRDNLNEQNQKLLEWYSSKNCYHGNFINTAMEEWHVANC